MNPFVYNQPVKGVDFFNRENEVEEIMKTVVLGKSQGNMWITGERQVGKTSLLQYIQLAYVDYKQKIKLYGTEKEFNVAFVFANVQYCDTEDGFYSALEIGLRNYFDIKILNSENSFFQIIEDLYESKKIFIVFLIDAFDALIQKMAAVSLKNTHKFLSDLATVIQGMPAMDYAKPFSCIFTADHTLDDLMTECELQQQGPGVIAESMELNWFSKEQVLLLAEHYLKNTEVRFTQEEMDFCYKITAGYPYFTQKLLALMYDKRNDYKNKNEFFATVRVKYGNDFISTLKGWGGDSMPKRTFRKLGKMAHEIGLIDKLIETGIKFVV